MLIDIDNSFRSKREVRYSDLDATFKTNINTRDISTRKNDEAIKQHIRLLFIDNGLPFRFDMHNGVTELLFENWSAHSKVALENTIRLHVERFEPRINVLEVSADFVYETQTLVVNFKYEMKEERREVSFKLIIRVIK